ncbi:MAG TPA: FixH family protein [Aliidongia sp.]|nr:FixH family protein [Aliidongia sp.]
MIRNRIVAGAFAFASGVALAALPSFAATADYKFELVGKPQLSGHKDVVQVRLVHVADGKPVADAVIFESKADMGPEGMAAMGAPVKALPVKDGVYSFEVDPGMAGTWALHLAAKVQGEQDTVRGTINADLVK